MLRLLDAAERLGESGEVPRRPGGRARDARSRPRRCSRPGRCRPRPPAPRGGRRPPRGPAGPRRPGRVALAARRVQHVLGESRSQESRREGVRRSPRRTKETTSRRVVPASRRAGCRGGGGRCHCRLRTRDGSDRPRRRSPRSAGDGSRGRRAPAAGRVEARAVAGAVQLGLLLTEGAAVVGAVAGVGGDVLPGPADQEHEGLLAAEVHQRRGVLGHVRQRIEPPPPRAGSAVPKPWSSGAQAARPPRPAAEAGSRRAWRRERQGVPCRQDSQGPCASGRAGERV